MRILKKLVPIQVKYIIRLSQACFFRYLTKPTTKGEVSKSLITALSDNKKNTFFGYHDKTPFSADDSKILAMSITASDKKAESECSPMNLGYFKKQGNGFASELTVFAQTTTWCWQQGCMLQWHPVNANTQVFFNALVNNAYGSILFDVERKQVIREYQYPIYSLDPTGCYAATLNFSRLGRLRPGYGYGLLPDDTLDDPAPTEDGLFLLDLTTGNRRLVVSIAELAQCVGEASVQHYVNHATFSPDGKRLVFFHLWFRGEGQGRGLRICELDVMSGIWCEVESERIVSHYCWRDADTLLATTLANPSKWHYTLYDRKANTRLDLNLPFNEDGHPMFHPQDKSVIVTDTYPDRRRDQHLCMVNLDFGKSYEVATLYSPMRYRGQVRCDLHPRWDRNGNYIAIDSTHHGKRAIYLVKVGQ
jgi:hypothetical protein